MSKNYCAKCDSIKNRLLRFGNTQDYASVVLKSKDVMKYRDTDVSVYRTIVDENRNHMEDIALIFMGRRITYRELLTQADRVSDILTSMNIRKEEISSFLAPIHPRQCPSFWPAARSVQV